MTSSPKLTRGQLLQITLLTTFVMTVLAMLVFWRRGIGMQDVFVGPMSWWKQAVLGSGAGGAAGLLVTLVVWKAQFFEGVRDISRDMLSMLNPGFSGTIGLSIAAGWGEELLFRGALQPWIGFWAASILFAAAHALLPRGGWGAVRYVAVVFVIGLGLGVLFHHAGLIAAMTAHAVYDFVALNMARRLLEKDT